MVQVIDRRILTALQSADEGVECLGRAVLHSRRSVAVPFGSDEAS